MARKKKADRYAIRRALSDPTRVRIVEALWDKPRTAKQLAATLGVVTNRLYHHLRILEHAQVIRVDHTTTVGRLPERVHAVTELGVWGNELAECAPREDRAVLFGSMLEATAVEIRDVVYAQSDPPRSGPMLSIARTILRTTPEQTARLWTAIEQAQVDAWEASADPSARSYRLVVALYEIRSSDEDDP